MRGTQECSDKNFSHSWVSPSSKCVTSITSMSAVHEWDACSLPRPLNRRMVGYDTQSKQKWKVIDKISQGFWPCGVLRWLFAHHPLLELSLGNYIQARYGNPDCQILGTLKNKIQIHGFLGFLSNNRGSDLIFRVAICLGIAKTAHIWDPWKGKWV